MHYGYWSFLLSGSTLFFSFLLYRQPHFIENYPFNQVNTLQWNTAFDLLIVSFFTFAISAHFILVYEGINHTLWSTVSNKYHKFKMITFSYCVWMCVQEGITFCFYFLKRNSSPKLKKLTNFHILSNPFYFLFICESRNQGFWVTWVIYSSKAMQ